MKIISIEGIDKAGKATQAKLLTDYLRNKGYKVTQSEFHRYDTPTGDLIMKWLKKEWDVDQTTIELIMAADKQAQQVWFDKLEMDDYDFLVLDRYTLSQVAYGIANGINGRWILELQKNMTPSDIDVVIDIPAEVSMGRKGKHNNGLNDRYESDLKMLKEVRNNYKNASIYYSAPIKKIVDGMKMVDEIHKEIVRIINDFMEGEI